MPRDFGDFFLHFLLGRNGATRNVHVIYCKSCWMFFFSRAFYLFLQNHSFEDSLKLNFQGVLEVKKVVIESIDTHKGRSTACACGSGFMVDSLASTENPQSSF